jgi:hypothetical protein
MGRSVSGAGDVNGDGYADVIVGAPLYSAGELYEGAAFLFLGSASGIGGGDPTAADAQLEGDQSQAYFGWSVSDAGDVDADAYADVIVGAPQYPGVSFGEGAAFLFHGSAIGIGDGNPTTAAAQLDSQDPYSSWGTSVAGAGDVNGDGYADVIVGAPTYGSGGSAFVFQGSAAGIQGSTPSTAAAQLQTSQANASWGFSVSGAGDVNGDGFADVIVGSESYSNGEHWEGAAFVYYGNTDGRPVATQQRRDDGSGLVVHPWGGSYDEDSFELALIATHPDGRGRVKLEVETCPSGVAFEDASCASQIGSGWTDVTATSGGVLLTESITVSPVPGSLYRWRARVLHAPLHIVEAGITEPPNPRHGPWRRLSGQAEEADVRLVPEPSFLLGLGSGLVLLTAFAHRRHLREV